MKKFKEKHIKSRKSKNGKWSFQVHLDYINNNDEICSYYQTFTETNFLSANDAFKSAIKHRNEMDIKLRGSGVGKIYSKGKKASSSNAMTVEKLYNEYPKYFSYTIETRKKHGYVYKQSIFEFAKKKINDISPADILYSMSSKTEIYSQDKLERILSVWKIIFKTAIYLGEIKYDPTICIEVPRSTKITMHRSKKTSLETIKLITDALPLYARFNNTKFNYQIIAYAILFSYYTGLRPSEVYMVRKSRIDLKNDLIYINGRVGSTKDRKNVEVTVKTENGIRCLPIVPEFKKLINEIMNFQKKDTDYLFADIDGNLISSTYQSDIIRLVSKKLGIEFNAYRVRSLFSKEIQQTNASAKTVISLMGHAHITQSIDYDYTDENEMRAALLNRKYN